MLHQVNSILILYFLGLTSNNPQRIRSNISNNSNIRTTFTNKKNIKLDLATNNKSSYKVPFISNKNRPSVKSEPICFAPNTTTNSLLPKSEFVSKQKFSTNIQNPLTTKITLKRAN